MICHELEDKIVEFHFNTLDKADYDRFADHIRTCPACLDKYLLHKRAVDFSPSNPIIPKSVEDRIAAELGDLSKPAGSQSFRPLLAFAVAASIVGVISVGFVLSQRPTTTEHQLETSDFDKNELILPDFGTI